MTTKIRPKGVMIPIENEGMYIKLIEKYGLTFALTFTKIVDCDPHLSLEEKIEASKIYLSEVGDILTRNFVHCEGHNLEFSNNYSSKKGFYIESCCPHCFGFESHYSVSPWCDSEGKPVHRASYKWESGLKRKPVTS